MKDRIDKFIAALNAREAARYAVKFPELLCPTFYAEHGRKFARIVRHEGPTDAPVSRSAFAFIDLATGDVLKPDGWKRPAKHARGSIMGSDFGLSAVGQYGPAYLYR